LEEIKENIMSKEQIENRIAELEKQAKKLVGKGFAYTEIICTISGLQIYIKKFA
jgi:hypothetical protein